MGVGLTGPQWSAGERSEPERDQGPVRPAADNEPRDIPNPEVAAKPERRRFTVEHKARIVREADACREPGQVGALLRREGLFSSQLTQWRKAYQKGALAALRDDKRGRKRAKHPLEVENERLKKKNTQLEKRLSQAEAIIDIQKKLSQILGDAPSSGGSE
jgi:transposase-like protein